jgi:hypothetical protein
MMATRSSPSDSSWIWRQPSATRRRSSAKGSAPRRRAYAAPGDPPPLAAGGTSRISARSACPWSLRLWFRLAMLPSVQWRAIANAFRVA